MNSKDPELIAIIQKYGIMVTRVQAAEILNLQPYHIDALANSGKITRIPIPSPKTGKPGKLVRYRASEVVRCL